MSAIGSQRKPMPSAFAITAAYTVVAVCIVVALIRGNLLSGLLACGLNEMANYPEVCAFLVIIGLGAIATMLPGSNHASIISIAGIAAFISITANQDALTRYLSLGALLFAIGMYGMVVSRNAVRVLMSIELMLNAVNINLVAFARYIDPIHLRGQIFAIFILTVAAAEAAVGLAIVLAIYRNTSTVDMEKFNILKW